MTAAPQESAFSQSFGQFLEPVTNFSDLLWGGTWNGQEVLIVPPLVVLLLGTGLYIMVGLRFYPLTNLIPAFRSLFTKSGKQGAGEISPFAALSTALSGQVGTGNLAGVATAIALGGPGAIFWMWITALVGMALVFGVAIVTGVRLLERRLPGSRKESRSGDS